MPGMVNPVNDEREALLAYLAQQRYVLRLSAFGLSDEQAAAAPTVSGLSVGGLIKHAALAERRWIDIALDRLVPEDASDAEDYLETFRLDGSLDDVLALADAVAAETEAAITSIDDLGRPVPVPRNVPWFPADVDFWSVRWVLLHLIEEVARHAGHADIVRESIDGATAFPLMAAAEGWEPQPWLQPWRPVALAR
jgi:uncharacterized damage-inducible protein DinB